jgi:hypothetical protein
MVIPVSVFATTLSDKQSINLTSNLPFNDNKYPMFHFCTNKLYLLSF